jgi:putative intracellular protease/amidase
MSGGRTAIENARGSQEKCSRAYRSGPANLVGGIGKPAKKRLVAEELLGTCPARNQQGVDGPAEPTKRLSARNRETAARLHLDVRRRRHDFESIAAATREYLERARKIENLDRRDYSKNDASHARRVSQRPSAEEMAASVATLSLLPDPDASTIAARIERHRQARWEIEMHVRTVAIMVFDDVDVLDFTGPYEVLLKARTEPGSESRRSLEGAPFNVVTVSKTGATVRADGGLRILPDYSFETVRGIDVLLVPGGFGTRRLLADEESLAWIRRTHDNCELTASVCTGSLLLAKSGLLKDRRATTHWAALDLLGSIDASIRVDRDSRFVVDGVVTSAGISAGIDMAFYLVGRFCGDKVASETASYVDYPWNVAAAHQSRK